MKKILCIIAVTLMGVAAIFAQSPNYQGIIYVTPTGAGTHSGDSWANATSSIADAQAIAQAHNAVVWVAAGTYYGDTTSYVAFIMKNGVDVYGGFVGNEPDNYDLALRDFETNATILDGKNSRRVLHQSQNFSTPTMWDGFVIQNGRTSSPYYEGGGVYLKGNSILNNCIIRNNISHWCTDNYAGGVYLNQSTLKNCKVSNNYSHNGGGIYAKNATVIDCEIYNNEGGYKGGGIYAVESMVSNCQIYDNVVSYDGGGVYADNNSSVLECFINNNTGSQNGGGVCADNNSTVVSCLITHNTNNSPSSEGTAGGCGGGAYVKNNSEISNCIISFNNAPADGGGGVSLNKGVAKYCQISNNVSYRSGGGLYSLDGSISNCLIYNNTVLDDYGGRGGGIHLAYRDTLKNSTIVNNNTARTAQSSGAGVSIFTNSLFRNCIVWGNKNNGVADNVCNLNPNYPATGTYSAIEGGYAGEHNIDISGQPLFVNPSLTAGAGDSTGNVDWHLLPNAVCINQGNNSFVTDSTDLDGLPRIGCNVVDMGCYEFYRVNHIYQTVSASYTWHGNTYTESGNYPWLGLLATHCDSLEVLHLTVGNVGIDNSSTVQEEKMRLYPNPTTGVVNVQFTNHNSPITYIQVFDIYGKLVGVVETCHGASLQTGTGASVQIQIDLSRYANGVYFIKAVTDGNVIGVRKVVKQ